MEEPSVFLPRCGHRGFLRCPSPDPYGFLCWPFHTASPCLHSNGLTLTFHSNDASFKKIKSQTSSADVQEDFLNPVLALNIILSTLA